MTASFAGRRAVVTGGANGIGYAVARRLVAGGAAVALWDIDDVTLAKSVKSFEEYGRCLGLKVDVSSPEAIEQAVGETANAFGSIDILINNAGITGPNAPAWQYKTADWRKVMALDLDGVFYCCRAVVPVMTRGNYGRIVNVASIAGKEGTPNASAYSAAKAGVIGFTKALGKELAATNVLVNCVAPAAVPTAIFDQMTKAHVDYMLSKIPMGRFGTVEEIASLICWLSSDECTFSTGAVFDASGGRATY